MSVVKQRLQTLEHAGHTYIIPLVILYVQHIYGTDKTQHCFARKMVKATLDSVNVGDRNLNCLEA